MGIVFVNQSTKITDAEVANIAEACDAQLQNEVAKAWDIKTPLRVATGLSAHKTWYPFFFVDDIPDDPDALAYHYVQDNGIPAGKIGVNATLAAKETVSSAASHEAVELQCDVFCATWSFSDRLGCLVATEACDPVQGDSYSIKVADGTKVPVSNFVTPYYFTEKALSHAVDHMGTLSETFDISPGGYQIRMKAGKVSNVFGAKVSKALKAGKDASHGRTYWRHVTMAIALGLGPNG
jgi:hypothetical protein